MKPRYLVINYWREDKTESGPCLVYTRDYLTFYDAADDTAVGLLGYEILTRYRQGTPLREVQELFALEYGTGDERVV